MRANGIIIDLGRTLMYFPREKELGSKLSILLGVSESTIDRRVIDLYMSRMNMSSFEFIECLCESFATTFEERKKIQSICEDYILSATLQSDALQCLANLRSRRLKMVLISNTTPLTKTCIDNLRLASFFDDIVLSCDIGLMKPDPRIFMHAMKLIHVTPEETCIVGDRIRTIVLGASVLGAKTVLVERRMEATVRNEQLPVEAIVPNLSELTQLSFLGGIG